MVLGLRWVVEVFTEARCGVKVVKNWLRASGFEFRAVWCLFDCQQADCSELVVLRIGY